MNNTNTDIITHRVAMGIEYDGTNYHGWQIQQHHDETTAAEHATDKHTKNTKSHAHRRLTTIQDAVEKALSQVADCPIKTVCAGRTDIGVHALEQVIHFDTIKHRLMRSWQLGTNNHLPKNIRVQWAAEVSPSFHARFSAVARHYRYIIYNNAIASALLCDRALWFMHPLDENKMQEAANYLIGEHDFSAFRASSCQSQSVNRHLHSIKVARKNELITIDVKANAFLHHMVRNIVGTLLPIGIGDKEPQWLDKILKMRDRQKSGITAKANGLYLAGVEYHPSHHLPNVKKNSSDQNCCNGVDFTQFIQHSLKQT